MPVPLSSPAAALAGGPAAPRDTARDWAIVDVETSGLLAGRHRVLSVAVITAGPDGTPAAEYSTLLDPGCDPGPVHVHGLTREVLAGAPTFEQVAGDLAGLLEGRVLVAHNAPFDHAFLTGEFGRAGVPSPIGSWLCTLMLSRRLALPTPNLKLGTLAAHYGVGHARAHDALEDTRALAGVFRGLLAGAAAGGVTLPVMDGPPAQFLYRPPIPKVPCAFRCPGRLAPGGPLVQGMKVAITGDTAVDRFELSRRGSAAGLDMMSSVSRTTSALVANDPRSGSAKARRALAEGVPFLTEDAFLALLDDVRPGVPR
ncbi:exonuclease domain-containing protein [Actinomadura parmotrematis]|uniref:DNA polymerase III n=1 Tax=Actinomadura parmotrematis TaxID=2864039 RepID=A0ABS7FTC9_9ACTN|nr:exonuclease domain-containing protein [Actinomadura parmotrematis]MBW8483666.1 hypothetical protein [Actinomadura parmotrematis]